MTTQEQDRLRDHFASAGPSQHASRWEHLWQDGTFLPWDRGTPSPALIDILTHRQDLVGTATESPYASVDIKQTESKSAPSGELHSSLPHSPHAVVFNKSKSTSRRRALVPGCGTGYDCYLLQARGWDVVGLDVSETAVSQARAFGQRLEGREEFAIGEAGKGSISFENGDFFALDEQTWMGKWDLVWDYTFLCALPPELRPKWSMQMAGLLAPGGRLICLEFPRTKDLRAGGPPFALPSPTYVALLSRPGVDIKYDEEMKVLPEDQQPPATDKALTRIAHFEPERTHAAGKGTDRVAVWTKQ